MRRMLHRCTTAVRATASGHLVYAPIVAAELVFQLESWYKHLPFALRFEFHCYDSAIPTRSPSSPGWSQVDSSPQISAGPLSTFLRTQYYSCQTSIYWPAVYQAISTGAAGPDLLPSCRLFFSNFEAFLHSVQEGVRLCPPNAWTLYASIFIFTMAVCLGLEAPCLQDCWGERTIELVLGTSELFDTVLGRSQSLAYLAELLRERVKVVELALNQRRASWEHDG